MTKSPGKSYTFQEWCKLRGFSRTTGWREVKDGKIRTYKTRGNRYVTEAADAEYVARMEAEASA